MTGTKKQSFSGFLFTFVTKGVKCKQRWNHYEVDINDPMNIQVWDKEYERGLYKISKKDLVGIEKI